MVDFVLASKRSKFRSDVEAAINKCSLENQSDTPDFILARYLDDCLQAFDRATKDREYWYGRLNREEGE